MLPIPSLESVLDLPPAAPMIRMKRGFATDAPLESLTRSEEGLFSVEARETDRLELSLGTLPDSMKRAMRAVRYAGYLVAGEELRPLPIGSTLEPVTGNFSWMLGPGFIGDYDLMFVEKDAYGSARTFKVRVTVKPKF